MDDVIIEDDVMGLEALDKLDARNALDQDSGSEASDDDMWQVDPVINAESLIRSLSSSDPYEGQVTALSESGTIGVAAAAAILSAKRRSGGASGHGYKFETNPAVRKRQQTRLLAKIRALCGEYCARVGQQAVFIAAVPGRRDSTTTSHLKIIGSSPFDSVIWNNRLNLIQDLDTKVAEYGAQMETASRTSETVESGSRVVSLPPLLVEGIPTALEEMTQATLRNFIPVLLKRSSGRGKPGWGVRSQKPDWWPDSVPWANIKSDMRTEGQKQTLCWTDALREIVKSCYVYHGQAALLTPFPQTLPKSNTEVESTLSEPVIQHIISSGSSQLILAATDANGVTIHIPVSMCHVTQNGVGGQQIQLIMPATSEDQMLLTSDGLDSSLIV